MKSFLRSNWPSFVIIFACNLFGFIFYAELPDAFASRFGWNGEPQSYMDKATGVTLLPLIMLLITILIPVLLKMSPRGYQMKQSARSVSRLCLSVVLALAVLYVGQVLYNHDPAHYSMLTFIRLFCATFLLAYGNFLSKTERNFFVGVRTPWTLLSEQNWFATHRFAAKVSVFTGFVLLMMLPLPVPGAIFLIGFLAALFLPFGYSFWFFRHRESTHAA